MTSDERRRVESIFSEAVEFPADQRQQWLESTCGDEPEILRSVVDMLAADATPHPLVDKTHSVGEIWGQEGDDQNQEPSRIGPYVITSLLGEGGMGRVYRANREDLGSDVAIKLLRRASTDPESLNRFQKEQRTLGALNHGTIARIFDAGVFSGRPWFAMELIDGRKLTEHCRVRNIDLVGRLQLFRAVCEAVSYAHNQLIVHLDLKPSNVLVNDSGAVKLVDFGIARNLQGSHSRESLAKGGRLMASLNYAAPEQLRGESIGLDTDIYALGVVLYELLTGRVPIDLTRASPLEWDALLATPPVGPSSSARQAPVDTDQPRPVEATVSEWEDLDALCLKAMHPDREQRYRTASALLEDLNRFLESRPLGAMPDTVAYRANKFVRRNRSAISWAMAVLLLFVAMAAYFTVRLVDSRNEAVAAAARTERIQELMLNLFEGEDAEVGPSQSLRVATVLDRGVQEARGLDGDPLVQAELLRTLGKMFGKLGRPARGEPLLRSAVQILADSSEGGGTEVLRASLDLTELLLQQDQLDEAQATLTSATRHGGDGRFRDQLLEGRMLTLRGRLWRQRGDYEQAIVALEQATEALSKNSLMKESAVATLDLAEARYNNGDLDGAEADNLRALEIVSGLRGEDHPDYAMALLNLGIIELDRGAYERAAEFLDQVVSIFEQWYGPKHPHVAGGLVLAANADQYQGRFDEAERLLSRALSIIEDAYGSDHTRVGVVLNHLGEVALRREQTEQATEHFGRAADIFKAALGEDHEYYLVQIVSLGGTLTVAGRHDEAIALLEPVVAKLTDQLGPNRLSAGAHSVLGRALLGAQRYQEAERELGAAFRFFAEQASGLNAEAKAAGQRLVRVYEATGQTELAEQLAARLTRQ